LDFNGLLLPFCQLFLSSKNILLIVVLDVSFGCFFKTIQDSDIQVKDKVAVHYQPFRGDPTEYVKDIPELERQAEDLSGTNHQQG